MSPVRRQRGVALIIALVLMALATILAVKVGFGGYLERKRTLAMLSAEQAYQFAMGAEALAADVLAQDAQSTKTDTLAEPWAQTPQPIPLRPPNDPEGEPLGTLQGALQDEQGRFNLNNLLISDANDASKPDPDQLALFKRILDKAQMDEKWADLIRDWIDADSEVTFPDGAEDAVYNSQDPPYLTGNWPMMSTSELLSLPGFGLENYQRLAPFVTALPPGTTINVCTAPGLVLDGITGNDEFAKNADFLEKSRKSASGCFPGREALLRDTPEAQRSKVDKLLSEKSDYFRLTTIVTLGTAEFTLYSLLSRKGINNRVTPILRSFGTT
ncbi:MAG: type II secretion system minor pseudopilin GspK [Proteobacteria bacterium]|nr:type II secretion system minor pseudopilin GspK [Pseudomonadota bacterium]